MHKLLSFQTFFVCLFAFLHVFFFLEKWVSFYEAHFLISGLSASGLPSRLVVVVVVGHGVGIPARDVNLYKNTRRQQADATLAIFFCKMAQMQNIAKKTTTKKDFEVELFQNITVRKRRGLF